MPHDINLITIIAMGFGLAMVLGFIAHRLRLPPLVGYLIAGIIIGPATPGIVADIGLAAQLAEIGVMLLMFGVGLHFSLDDLMSVKKIAIPGALVQISTAVLMGMGVAFYWGWSLGGALVFGFSLSVASTVVLLKALEARGVLESINGRIAVGWLIVEDLVMVLVLVMLPALATVLVATDAPEIAGSGESIWKVLTITLLKVAAFIALMLIVGRRALPKLLWLIGATGSRELFTLGVVTAAIGIAFAAAELFGVSFALGAFFAGMMMRESALSRRAANESLPLRDAFAVLFFVSVGMLFDPSVIWQEPLHLLIVLGIILIGKTFAAVALVLLFRYPLNTALTVGASLAQIGEFSFILGGLGVALGVMPAEGQSLILAGALISIAVNPAIFFLIDPFQHWARARSALARRLELRDDPLAQLPMSVDHKYLAGQVVIAGYGRVGERVAAMLAERNVPYVVADQNRELVDALRHKSIPAVSGDVSTPEVLIQAHIARAAVLVIAIHDTVHVRTMVDIARTLNPDIRIVVRTHSPDEAALLKKEQVGAIFLGEEELARGMTESILTDLTPAPGH